MFIYKVLTIVTSRYTTIKITSLPSILTSIARGIAPIRFGFVCRWWWKGNTAAMAQCRMFGLYERYTLLLIGLYPR